MTTRTIGSFKLHPIGLGCMNFTHGYSGLPSKQDALSAIAKALDYGVNHMDVAALYGAGQSELLVGEALKGKRDKYMLATKGGLKIADGKRIIDGSAAAIRRDCEESLQRLQTDVIDLYYLHRWEKTRPIEETVLAMADLVKAGKVKHIGLSEVSANTLRKAHAIHPIAAIQTEYSLWTREPEIGVLQACQELGTAFVAFSPVARGFLTAQPPVLADLGPKDLRQNMPRFSAENYPQNMVLFTQFKEVAASLGCTPAQLALAWLLHKAPYIHAIPGTRNAAHIEENQAALAISLTPEQFKALDKLINQHTVKGNRYPASQQADVDTEQFA